MAEQWAGAVKKRRRSTGESSGAGQQDVRELQSILAVHTCPVKKHVVLEGCVVAADQEVETRAGLGRKGGGREVAGFLLADENAIVQVALWGEQAKTLFPKLVAWLEGGEDGEFPRVRLAHVQVSHVKAGGGVSLRRLQSTPRTTLEKLGDATITIQPAPELLVENAATMMQPKQVVCFRGTVTRVESKIYSQDDIGMVEIGVTMRNGFEVPVMLYGVQSEEPPVKHEKICLWFGEAKEALPDREGSKGFVWLYGSGFILSCGGGEPLVSGRPMDISTPSRSKDEEEADPEEDER